MPVSNYISRYISEANSESKRASNPKWLKNFFKEFSDNLVKRNENATVGNKYIVTGAFSDALTKHLFPNRLKVSTEVSLSKHINPPKDQLPLADLLNRKRVDYAIEGKEKTLLIEFKTNIQFNDFAAAMVEMAAVKKYKSKTIVTSSLHLFPYRTNVDGLRSLNIALGKPLDHVWVLCKSELEFDIEAIKAFRREVVGIVV